MIDKSVHSEIVRRSMTDPDFRERLLADPSSTIAEVTGIDVPEDLEVVVVENGQGKAHVVLPPDDVALDQLDDIAAGRRDVPSWWVCWGM